MIRVNDIHAIRLVSMASMMQFVPRIHHCIANYNDQDQLTGGVMFTDYWGNGGSCQVHVAGFRKGWATKSLLYLTFDYPFRQLQVRKIFGLVPEYNVAARNLNLHLGFKIEYLAKEVFGDVGEVDGMYLMSMHRDECKWLDMKMPFIEYAPLERTNRIDLPLAYMPTEGMMQ